MKILDCVQGTPEWFQARLGIPSASNFDMIVTTKGEPSKQRTKYMYRLAGEFVAGKAEEGYQSQAMLNGVQTEEEARSFYEFTKGVEVKQVGFCVSDCGRYGCSPDGLIGDNCLIEIKCPTVAVHVGYLLDNSLPTDYFQQTQGQLLVTGREYVDFVSYYPCLKPLIVRVERDEKFLALLESELKIFYQELQEVINKIKGDT